MSQSLPPVFETQVPTDWVDFNGHMNDAAYAIAFSHATDQLMDRLGMDAAWRERSGCTIYTLESHIRYLQEAHEGQHIHVTAQLLGHDSKRLRVFHRMHRRGEEKPLATSEQLLLHVDARGPSAAPFDAETRERIAQLAAGQADLPIPAAAGRGIRTLTMATSRAKRGSETGPGPDGP